MAEPEVAGPSRRATVMDEDEEIKLEAGVPVSGPSGSTPNGTGADGEAKENGAAGEGKAEGEGEGEEGPSSSTLYLHNLNEKVQVPGMCCGCCPHAAEGSSGVEAWTRDRPQRSLRSCDNRASQGSLKKRG